LDELYSKDTKVPLIDLEIFADEHIKSVEETKFENEMKKLQTELDQLELGKYSPPHSITATSTLRCGDIPYHFHPTLWRPSTFSSI
jgi:hypothetical protein